MRTLRIALVPLLLFALAPLGWAALGGDQASVATDAKVLSSQHTVTTGSGFSVHVLSAGREQLREYSDRNGKVFALSWNGRKHPDLKTVLGDHFKEFKEALAEAKRQHLGRGRAPIVFDQGNLHIELGGRMMHVYGRVWLKDSIPEGVGVAQIQ